MLDITNINTALDALSQSQELLEDSNSIKTNALGVMLETLKHYETEGYNVNAVKQAVSEAKRAFIQFGSLAEFNSWEDMRKACKPEDAQADAKALFKDIMKTAKTLDNGWNTYIEGALEKLLTELPKK